MIDKNTISICIIVRDEEIVIDRCLRCVSKFADEIIIVDTGSSDRTKEIARHYTSKIYDFEWCYDFSMARNYAFSLAKCEYVMWLDADDYIDDKNIQRILDLKKELNADVYMAKYTMGFNDNGKSTFCFYRERILRRERQFQFKGFIHEAIEYYGRVVYTDIEIEHRKGKSGDSKRNLKIYNYNLGRGVKLDARAQYYYSKELYYNGYYSKCITNLKKFLKNTLVKNRKSRYSLTARENRCFFI